jgi:general secretion pathway protein J
MTTPGPGHHGGGITPATGFSLIEMLVALAVLGLAAVLLGAGIGRVGLSLDLASRGDQRIDRIAAAQFVLRQRIAGTQPVNATRAGITTIDFAGLDSSVDFIADPARNAAPDALQRYRLARDPDGDLVLFRLSTLNQRVDYRNRATVGWTAQPLVQGTAALEIRYFGSNELVRDKTPAWQENWTRRSALPTLVRVRVIFPEGDLRVWPDLIVRPRAAVPAPCPPDATTGGCAPAQMPAQMGAA